MSETRDRGTSPRVLLVEDDEADAYLFQSATRSFRWGGERLETVGDGPALLARLRDPSAPLPDLVLLDLNLPGENGLELLDAIRGEDRLRRLPVAVFSGSRSPTDISESYARGANCYLQKPDSIDGIEHLVKTLDAFWFGQVMLPGDVRGRRAAGRKAD